VLGDAAFPVNVLRRFGWCHSLGLAPEKGHKATLGPYGPPVVESFAVTPRDQPWMIHLGEGSDAIAGAELDRLAQLGCLSSNTVLIHGVALGADGVQQVIASGAAVVWCPASNLALLGTTLDPRRLFDAGRLALGSDSRLSGSRDLLDEVRVAAAHSDLTPAELLQLATVAGSRVLGMDEAGGLAPGQRADLLVARDTGADPRAAFVELRRRDLRAVVVGGRPSIADPDLEHWFRAAGVDAVPVTLDGRPKLLARSAARPGATAIEPGLEVVDP
jgi:cytosine/adenosine deaminase-related metal-dependent hydrolase